MGNPRTLNAKASMGVRGSLPWLLKEVASGLDPETKLDAVVVDEAQDGESTLAKWIGVSRQAIKKRADTTKILICITGEGELGGCAKSVVAGRPIGRPGVPEYGQGEAPWLGTCREGSSGCAWQS